MPRATDRFMSAACVTRGQDEFVNPISAAVEQ